MKCQQCQRNISEDDSYQHLGRTLCEDCYMDTRNPSQACDPWAVYTATRTRDSAGTTGLEGLTPLQQEICNYIKDKGKVTPEEIGNRFNLTPRDMQNTFATLRHCELVRGQKEGDKVYLVPFN